MLSLSEKHRPTEALCIAGKGRSGEEEGEAVPTSACDVEKDIHMY